MSQTKQPTEFAETVAEAIFRMVEGQRTKALIKDELVQLVHMHFVAERAKVTLPPGDYIAVPRNQTERSPDEYHAQAALKQAADMAQNVGSYIEFINLKRYLLDVTGHATEPMNRPRMPKGRRI